MVKPRSTSILPTTEAAQSDALINCRGGCGFVGDKSQLHYEPSGRGAYRREEFYCDKCHEKRLALKKLMVARANYRNLRRRYGK